MTLLVWKGRGYLVPLISVTCLGLSDTVFRSTTGDPGYFDSHGWPKALGLFLAAGLVGLIAFCLNKNVSRLDAEVAAGLGTTTRRADSLMGIPVLFWGPILFAWGVFYLFSK